jgi:hypothetical protein
MSIAQRTSLAAKERIKREIRTRRNRSELAELDYKRALKDAYQNAHLSQVELAEILGITQPSVSYAVKKAQSVPELWEGFSGASPYEICLRYDIGELNREQLIDELSRWEYAVPSKTDGCDTLLVDVPGTFREVERATLRGLIEEEVYEEVLNRVIGSD